ncbi:ABC transporter permease [Bifidobacterium callitrichos]|uniref:ABC transporter permease n=1 Tax=Bifidobacterium callitrichos TaxID=762209 RepID=A0A5M9ZDF3_9BIFI|nr:ABC transporter permease [Bifidobacterium callitrichos]KAA8817150.1 ABC transporter permease [Bifidobacterium callitrichos]
MNTCKATLRVLIAHRIYILVYLIGIGVMMLALGGSELSGNRPVGDTYTPGKADVAVIDRDANRGGVADAMRAYLAVDNDLTDLDDDPETLQQAVASNWVDLIVIIPDGYADGLVASVSSEGGKTPEVETVTSYTSGLGAMASMDVSGFLSLTRTALIGGNVTVDPAQLAARFGGTGAGASAQPNAIPDGMPRSFTLDGSDLDEFAESGGITPDQLPEGTLKNLAMDDLKAATKRAVDTARDKAENHAIAVDHSAADASTSTTERTPDRAADGFGGLMEVVLYPLFLAMTVCTSLVLGVFNAGETRRRLYASPQRSSTMSLQRMATLCGFALVVVAGYFAIVLAMMAAAGVDPSSLAPTGVAMTVTSTCVYALMTVACGFLLGECGFNDIMANGFANVFGLVILFTSGVTFPLDLMPAPMIAIGRMLPGWWYCASIDDALGIGSASASGVDAIGWGLSIGIVALFAVAFVCIGLAVGRVRRLRPASFASTTTQLTEA